MRFVIDLVIDLYFPGIIQSIFSPLEKDIPARGSLAIKSYKTLRVPSGPTLESVKQTLGWERTIC